jgi:hypothetical protein
MMRGWLIEDEGRTPEAFRRELVDPDMARMAQRARESHGTRLVGEWVFDRSGGRPALRCTWSTKDTAHEDPSSRVA